MDRAHVRQGLDPVTAQLEEDRLRTMVQRQLLAQPHDALLQPGRDLPG
jgi:hypothetical protein